MPIFLQYLKAQSLPGETLFALFLGKRRDDPQEASRKRKGTSLECTPGAATVYLTLLGNRLYTRWSDSAACRSAAKGIWSMKEACAGAIGGGRQFSIRDA